MEPGIDILVSAFPLFIQLEPDLPACQQENVTTVTTWEEEVSPIRHTFAQWCVLTFYLQAPTEIMNHVCVLLDPSSPTRIV